MPPANSALNADLPRAATLEVRGAAKLPEKLALHRDAAYLAQSLTRIHCAVPLAAEREQLQRGKPDLESLTAFCTQQGFGAMLPKQAGRIAAL